MQLFGEVQTVKASLVASPDYEAEQAATLIMRFKEGTVGVLQCHFGTINVPDRLEIVGTKGRITVEDLNQGNLLLYNAAGVTKESHPPANNLHSPLIEDFSTAIADGRSPTVSGRVGKQTNVVIQLAYEEVLA